MRNFGQIGGILVICCSWAGHSHAADNLNCEPRVPPPPYHYGSYGHGAPIANIWVSVKAHQTARVCFNIPSNSPIQGLGCYAMEVIFNEYPNFSCPLDSSCSGIGTFTSPSRNPSTAKGKDAVCITYQNQNGINQ